MEGLEKSGSVTAVLISRRWLASGILELHFTRPSGFSFIPGQFLRIEMDGYQRDYTLVSKTDAETLVFCVALVDGGRFSNEIVKADMGTELQVSGPHGHFVYRESANPAVLVASGTGVAPFVAFCRSGVSKVILLHGVDSPEGLIYRELLQSRLREYVPCISRPYNQTAGLSLAFSGHVTQYLETYLKPGTYDFYLCGRPSMIRDATAIIDTRFYDSRLFIETYD